MYCAIIRITFEGAVYCIDFFHETEKEVIDNYKSLNPDDLYKVQEIPLYLTDIISSAWSYTDELGFIEPYEGYLKEQKKAEFDLVFSVMDAKRIRPASQLTLASLENTLTTENIDENEDANILWQLNEIAEENRRRLAEMLTMTDYEQIINVKPINPYAA